MVWRRAGVAERASDAPKVRTRQFVASTCQILATELKVDGLKVEEKIGQILELGGGVVNRVTVKTK